MAKTQSEILNNILGNIDSSYNKSRGEFIWDLSNAVAKIIADGYKKQDEKLNSNYVATASNKDLDTLINQRIGKTRKESTFSSGKVRITGSVGAAIKKGMLVANNTNNYEITEDTIIPVGGVVSVSVICKNTGLTGNTEENTIIYFPKTIEGLKSVNNEAAFDNGFDTETDTEYKKRYFDYVSTPSTSGNIFSYKNWTMEVTGVGDCIVIPNAGNVKVVVIDSNFTAASEGIINEVKKNIEKNRPVLSGTLSVVSATKLEINISVNVTYDLHSYSEEQIKTNIENEVIKYLKDNYGNNIVSYAKLGYYIFNAEGVQDHSNLLINDGTNNIEIDSIQVAQLGGVTIA